MMIHHSRFGFEMISFSSRSKRIAVGGQHNQRRPIKHGLYAKYITVFDWNNERQGVISVPSFSATQPWKAFKHQRRIATSSV
jgi:hypothetical protein